jgi:biopolymer transport protein ExbB
MRTSCVALLVALTLGAPAAARAADAPASRDGGSLILQEKKMGLWELYLKGGIVMHAIMIASITALGFAIERGVALRQPIQAPGGLVEETMGRLSRGGTGAAASLVEGKSVALARLLGAALSKLEQGHQAMEDAVVETSYDVLYDLRRNIRPLGIVASVAPLMGLLGTVFGMIKAFDRVSAGGLGRGEKLAGGIAEALVTTGAGLLVAIPALLLYHFYRGRSEDLVRAAETQANGFIERALGAGAPKPAGGGQAARPPGGPTP